MTKNVLRQDGAIVHICSNPFWDRLYSVKVINIRYSFSKPDWDEAREHLTEKEIRGLLYLGGLGYVNKIIGEKQAVEHTEILEERDE